MQWDPDFRDSIVAAAAAEGLTLSAYLQRAATALRDGELPPGPVEQAQVGRLVFQVRRLGQNINRLLLLEELRRGVAADSPAFQAEVPDGAWARAHEELTSTVAEIRQAVKQW